MGNGDQLLLKIPSRVHTLYDAYCDILLAPVSASPVDADEEGAGGAQQPADAGDGDEPDRLPGALRAPVPLAEINPIESATPLVQK